MKNLITLLAAVAFTTAAASADTLFDPTFNPSSTPTSTAPAGYTSGTNDGGTATYSNGQMLASDVSAGDEQAYITSTVADPNTNVINIQFTLVPTYTYTGTSGGQVNIPILELNTPGGNNSLLTVTFVVSSYDNRAYVDISTGIQYGGSTTGSYGQTGYPDNSSSANSPIDALSGKTLTFNLTETITKTGAEVGGATPYTVTNDGTLSEGSTVLTTYDTTTTGSTVNDAWDPVNNPLTASLGIITPGSSAPAGFFASPATVAFSDVLITTPEPSTFALLLGGLGLLVLMVRRRMSA
jgi:hypothetical protein